MVLIDPWRPIAGLMTLRTGNRLCLPVDLKISRETEACSTIRLPKHIFSDGSTNHNPIICFGIHQQLGANVARIHQMFTRQETFGGERSMNSFCGGDVLFNRIPGFHICNNMRAIIFAGFGQMHFVPDPGCGAFRTIARIHIVGRWIWSIPLSLVVVRTQMDLICLRPCRIFHPVLLHPNLP